MASQRLLIATLGGRAAAFTVDQFLLWRNQGFTAASKVNRFCEALRVNDTSLSILYHCVWIDRWLMGDSFPAHGIVETNQYCVTCLTCKEAIDWASQCRDQYAEQQWLAGRLREAVAAGDGLTDNAVIIFVREVFDVSAGDDQIKAELELVPPWLSQAIEA